MLDITSGEGTANRGILRMAGQYWRRIKLVACLVAGCCLLAGSALALELGGVELSLHSTTKYQYQWSDKPADFMLNQDDSDQDLFETLNDF